MPKYKVIQWEKGFVVKDWIVEADNLEEAKEKAIPQITIEEIKMETYTKKEEEAMDKAVKILTKAGLSIEASEDMPDSDGLERWCIHPKEEN